MNFIENNFEFDTNKSISNKEKHGIDFIEAQKLWQDTEVIELQSKNQELEENRFIVIGKINNKFYSAIITYRGKNIRIISVRRSRKQEIELYANN
jgi:uncharacterized DUF497 family protein